MFCCSCSKQVFLNSIILKYNWIRGVHNTSDFQTNTEESQQTNTSILEHWPTSAVAFMTFINLMEKWLLKCLGKKNMCHSYYLSSNPLNICHVTCQLGNTVTHLCWPALGNSGIIYYYTQKRLLLIKNDRMLGRKQKIML